MTDPTATPDLQARYDILAREVQRERAELAKMKASRDGALTLCDQVITETAHALGCEADNEAILQEVATLRLALGLREVAG